MDAGLLREERLKAQRLVSGELIVQARAHGLGQWWWMEQESLSMGQMQQDMYPREVRRR
jgi:hypothetical protein